MAFAWMAVAPFMAALACGFVLQEEYLTNSLVPNKAMQNVVPYEMKGKTVYLTRGQAEFEHLRFEIEIGFGVLFLGVLILNRGWSAKTGGRKV